MGKKKTAKGETSARGPFDAYVPHGPKIAAFLISRGFVVNRPRLQVSEAARHISKHRGKELIRQRLSKITRSDRVRASTLEEIAGAFGVTPGEMLSGQILSGQQKDVLTSQRSDSCLGET